MKPERNLKEKGGVQVGDVSAWTSGSDEADIPEPFDVVDAGGQEVRPPDRRVRLADRRDARHAGTAGELQHATGRPDAVLRTEKGIYVFEFKFAQSAAAALAQCRERNYAARFAGENLPVYYVGVNYNPAADVRTIDDVKCERIDAKRTYA